MDLTNKQRVFCERYLTHWNATQAALEAGYSKTSVRAIASENLTKPNIRSYCEKRMSEMALAADEVLFRLGQHARAGINLFLDEHGNIDMQQVRVYGHLVKSLRWTKYGPRIELHDPQSALVHLGRHHKLFTDKVELIGWQKEILDLLRQGSISEDDIINELGTDIAQDFFESVGISFAGLGPTQEESTKD